MGYANGRYPLNLFIHRGGNIYLTPSLNARWDEMVRLALEKYGVRLWITGDIDGLGGWNGYRTWDAQGRYKAYYGNKAAAQGYSSHGGRYQGQEVFALDIANVDDLAPGNPALARARLTALAQTVGLRVNFVTPTEWWHVGDFNNPWVAPVFGHVTVNPTTTNRPNIEEDSDMKPIMWNGRVWMVGFETIAYVRNLAALSAVKKVTGINIPDLSNDELTETLLFLAIPWEAAEATYQSRAFDNQSNFGNGTFWSRQMAEAREQTLRDQGFARSIDELAEAVK
jgi:hypothetical protein